MVLPVQVITDVSSKPFFVSSFITARTPPARSRSSMNVSPAGARWQRFGVWAEISFAWSRLMVTPASCAMAGRWSIVFVEQPSAMSTVSALLNAAGVMMSRGRMFFSTSVIICIPACLARRRRAEYGAGIVPLPGSPMPSASVRQFMEFAVYMPEQLPQDGQAFSS